jgi:hypothetical protein
MSLLRSTRNYAALERPHCIGRQSNDSSVKAYP